MHFKDEPAQMYFLYMRKGKTSKNAYDSLVYEVGIISYEIFRTTVKITFGEFYTRWPS